MDAELTATRVRGVFANTITVISRDEACVTESDEGKAGVTLDYDDDQGNFVSVEILDAFKRVTEARKIRFQEAQ